MASQEKYINTVKNDFLVELKKMGLSKKSKELKHEIEVIHEKRTSARSKIIKRIEEYANLKQQILDGKHHQFIAKGTKEDPWLQEVCVMKEVKEFAQQDFINQQNMLKVKQDIITFENQWMSNLAIFYQRVFELERISNNPLVDGNLNPWDSLMAMKDHVRKEYWIKHGLDNDILWANAHNIESCLHSSPSIKIIKEGNLKRPGKYRKEVWKNGYVVLTESGFLHCFKDPLDASAMSLSTLTLETTSKSPNNENMEKRDPYFR